VSADAASLLLMTPGPTRVPDRVLAAGARPMIHHRTDEFSDEVRTVVTGLGALFGTSQPVLPVHTTGRGGTEAAIANLFSDGDEIVACCNGRFGEMWARIAEAYGIVVHRVATDWLRDVDLDELDAKLSAHPTARAVSCTFTDTSTGVCNDIGAIAAVAWQSCTGLSDCFMRVADGAASVMSSQLAAPIAMRTPSTISAMPRLLTGLRPACGGRARLTASSGTGRNVA